MSNYKRLLYIRSAPYKVNINGYNLQEIGFCKSLCKYGYQCDIVYYSNENKDEVIYSEQNRGIRLLWRKGIRLLRSGVYPKLLKKDFLNQYDLVILTEYDQIMTYLISKYTNKSVLYSGPYYNLFKIPFVEPIYCRLFNKSINRNIHIKFAKSQLSKNYLEERKFENVQVLGVALDDSKFSLAKKEDYNENHKVESILEFMNEDTILYVGTIDKRKNTEFILRIFNKLKKKKESFRLVIIGKGSKSYTRRCFSMVEDRYKKDIMHVEFVKNGYLGDIYNKAKIFLLPSRQEIFGMVLLEAMYFGVPSISSCNGGSMTLIDNNVDGIVIDNFQEDIWIEEIMKLDRDDNLYNNISKNAMKKIRNNFLWDKIADKFIKSLSNMNEYYNV